MDKKMGVCPVCQDVCEMNPNGKILAQHEFCNGKKGIFVICEGSNQEPETIVK